MSWWDRMGYGKPAPKPRLKAHLPASAEETLCGRSRLGGTETLVGPLRAQLFPFVCKRCIARHSGPLAPNLEPGQFTVNFEEP